MRTEDDLKEIKESLHRIAYGGPSIGNLWFIIVEMIVFNVFFGLMLIGHTKLSLGSIFALFFGVSAVLLFLSRRHLIPLFICYAYVSFVWSIVPYAGLHDSFGSVPAWVGAIVVFAFSMWLHIVSVTGDVYRRTKVIRRRK